MPTTAPTSSHHQIPPATPIPKIPKSVCAISNGAWRSHFFQIPRSLSSLTLPALPPITLGISSGIAWVSCSCSPEHFFPLHTHHSPDYAASAQPSLERRSSETR